MTLSTLALAASACEWCEWWRCLLLLEDEGRWGARVTMIDSSARKSVSKMKSRGGMTDDNKFGFELRPNLMRIWRLIDSKRAKSPAIDCWLPTVDALASGRSASSSSSSFRCIVAGNRQDGQWRRALRPVRFKWESLPATPGDGRLLDDTGLWLWRRTEPLNWLTGTSASWDTAIDGGELHMMENRKKKNNKPIKTKLFLVPAGLDMLLETGRWVETGRQAVSHLTEATIIVASLLIDYVGRWWRMGKARKRVTAGRRTSSSARSSETSEAEARRRVYSRFEAIHGTWPTFNIEHRTTKHKSIDPFSLSKPSCFLFRLATFCLVLTPSKVSIVEQVRQWTKRGKGKANEIRGWRWWWTDRRRTLTVGLITFETVDCLAMKATTPLYHHWLATLLVAAALNEFL